MSDADAAIVVTEWPELKTVDWSAAGRSMRRRVLFDGRNVLDPNAMASAGFIYMSVGRATVLPMPSDASSRGGAGMEVLPSELGNQGAFGRLMHS